MRSPIQQWSPIVSFQGKWIFTLGLINSPVPTSHPKALSSLALRLAGHGHADKKNVILVKYHIASTGLERPLSKWDLSNRSFRTGGGTVPPRARSLLRPGDDVIPSSEALPGLSKLGSANHF